MDDLSTIEPEYSGDQTGEKPDVSDSLKSKGHVVGSISQAFQIAENLIYDWKKGITNAARITAKLNGERPYNQKKLKDAGKDWKTNINTGFLTTECARVLPRLFMPIKTAKYLTASALPPGWDQGTEKTEFFRQVITETVRSWPKFNFYIRGLAREVGMFGFGFNVWPDEYDWRPNLVRMDKGFVPMGTELMEEPAFFLWKYDYKPSELLEILKKSIDAGREEWKKDNTVKAINQATVPVNGTLMENSRSYEELIRQAAWIYNYNKGEKVIRSWHLFAKEADGKVSHYILLADNGTKAVETGAPDRQDPTTNETRLLYQNEDKYDSMWDAVNTMTFDYGDGTVHGSWGAGQILYDLAAQVEKIRCDSIDNLRMSNKVKIVVAEGKNMNDVKLVINDQYVAVTGAQMSGNTAGMPVEVEGYEKLDLRLSQLAQQKIGAFVPPIPLQPTDIKAAQINAAMQQEKDLQESLLENWLIQFAFVMMTITKRLCDPKSPDDVAKAIQKVLAEKLNDAEIKILAAQFPVKSVIEFTEFKAGQRAAFAQSVMGNALFSQHVAARTMADGVGDQRFVDAIVLPEGDQSDQIKAAHDQMLENSAMLAGQSVPVLTGDLDWVHMQQMKPALIQSIQNGNTKLSSIGLQHYAAHYTQGVEKKTIPKESINDEKSWIAEADKAVAALVQRDQIAQHAQQVQELAAQQAQKMIQEGHPAATAPAAPAM